MNNWSFTHYSLSFYCTLYSCPHLAKYGIGKSIVPCHFLPLYHWNKCYLVRLCFYDFSFHFFFLCIPFIEPFYLKNLKIRFAQPQCLPDYVRTFLKSKSLWTKESKFGFLSFNGFNIFIIDCY